MCAVWFGKKVYALDKSIYTGQKYLHWIKVYALDKGI